MSIDFRGNPHSSILDAPYTNVMDGDFVKVLAWYDNEWGYSSRCVDLLKFIEKKGSVVARSITDLRPVRDGASSCASTSTFRSRTATITDDTRIRASLPTIEYAARQGRDGDPRVAPRPAQGQAEPGVLAQAGRRPAVGAARRGRCSSRRTASASTAQARDRRGGAEGGVVLLENLRFHAEEEKNDPAFAKQLAELADVYINDAFGSAHRAHASTEGIVQHVKEAGAGLLMGKEVEYLGRVSSSTQIGRSWRSSAARRCPTSSR